MFRKKVQGEIRELRQNLEEILDEDSGGRVTVFTDNKEIKELAAQINRRFGWTPYCLRQPW